MTKPTSSRSVKGTPKTDDEPDTNGTQPIDNSSVNISLIKRTSWILEMETGPKRRLTIEGGNGRVSYSRDARSSVARFYRTESAKSYEAVVSGITAIYSDRCKMETASRTGTTPVSPVGSRVLKTPPPPWEEEIF